MMQNREDVQWTSVLKWAREDGIQHSNGESWI